LGFERSVLAQEPVIAEPSPAAIAKASASFRPAVSRNAPEIVDHRLAYHATNYFTLLNLIGPFQETLRQRTVSSEVLGEPMANVMKRAGREAAREIALRSMRAEDLLAMGKPRLIKIWAGHYSALMYLPCIDSVVLDFLDEKSREPSTERARVGEAPERGAEVLGSLGISPALQ